MSSTDKTCEIEAELWLDFAEDELDPSLKGELSLHIVGCTSCQKQLKEFQAIQSSLKVKDDIPDDDFFQHLEGKIMAKVATEGIAAQYMPRAWRAHSRRALTIMVLFLLVVTGPLLLKNIRHLNKTNEVSVANTEAADEWMVQTSNQDLGAFGDVINAHENTADLLLDASAHKMANLDESELRQRLGL